MEIEFILKKNIEDLSKIYFIYGEEIYLIEDFLEKFKRKFVDKNFTQFNFSFLKGDEKYCNLSEAVMTPPFMYPKRIIFFQAEKIFQQKGNDDWLFLEKIPDTTVLVIYSFNIPDKRLKKFKLLKKYGVIIETKKLTGRNLHLWITEQFAKYNKKISREGLEILKNSFNQNLQRLKNEIEKISMFCNREFIDKDDVLKVISRDLYLKDNLIFDLVDAVGNKKLKKALRYLNEMNNSGESMIGILVMIARQFRLLLLAKEARMKGYSPYETAKIIGEHPYPVKKCYQQCENFSFSRLERGLELVLEANENIISGKYTDDLALELLLIQFDEELL